eukprot:scaffold48954_cov82-Phaeocystis_antarctica.AAC.3
MGIPMNNDSAKRWHQLGLHVRQQKQPAPSAEVRRTTPEVVCAPPDMHPRTRQVLRARKRTRASTYAELQSKQRAAYGDDEAAREAAGKAALLRAKKSLSTGWAARLCCEQRKKTRIKTRTLKYMYTRCGRTPQTGAFAPKSMPRGPKSNSPSRHRVQGEAA